MDKIIPGSSRFQNTNEMIREIDHLIHFILNKEWMSREWQKLADSANASIVHPLVVVAFKAHKQIEEFIAKDASGMTEEIFELTELASKINVLKKSSVIGLDKRLRDLTSMDFTLYRTARYEIQIAGMLLQRGHCVTFIEEGDEKTPDILVSKDSEKCEIECKHKDPDTDQLDYIRSIYNNTQRARKQFSKSCPGVITIEVDKVHFKDFEIEINRLKEEMFRAMRNSSSISGILVTSKVFIEDEEDYVYKHLVKGFLNPKPRYRIPGWLLKNLVNVD
jgi:hypothetical protein